jgi:hypothetical protein
MHKKLVDGQLVDVDDNGNVIPPVNDGPAVGPAATVTPSSNSASNPVGNIGPLEGKNNDGVSGDQVLHEAKEAMVNTPGRVSEANKDLEDSVKADLKENPVDPKVERKIEGEGRAAADRDLPEARNLPHPGPNEPENADTSAVREDGTVTTQHHPELTATYLHGTRVLISDEQRAKYHQMIKELFDLHGDAGVGDIPLGDPYWAKKAELDAFVARLKR